MTETNELANFRKVNNLYKSVKKMDDAFRFYFTRDNFDEEDMDDFDVNFTGVADGGEGVDDVTQRLSIIYEQILMLVPRAYTDDINPEEGTDESRLRIGLSRWQSHLGV